LLGQPAIVVRVFEMAERIAADLVKAEAKAT
jgi:hypothetical protein